MIGKITATIVTAIAMTSVNSFDRITFNFQNQPNIQTQTIAQQNGPIHITINYAWATKQTNLTNNLQYGNIQIKAISMSSVMHTIVNSGNDQSEVHTQTTETYYFGKFNLQGTQYVSLNQIYENNGSIYGWSNTGTKVITYTSNTDIDYLLSKDSYTWEDTSKVRNPLQTNSKTVLNTPTTRIDFTEEDQDYIYFYVKQSYSKDTYDETLTNDNLLAFANNIISKVTETYTYTVEIDPTQYEVIDIPDLMFSILGMPFAWISTAFNLTIFPGTPYAINISHIFFAVIGSLILIYIIKKVIK